MTKILSDQNYSYTYILLNATQRVIVLFLLLKFNFQKHVIYQYWLTIQVLFLFSSKRHPQSFINIISKIFNRYQQYINNVTVHQ